ncbi:ND6 [Clunio marinus]|uniref:NADH-ubiquinone oxidoreductase chain 6 n=1 Tax=Clunio marinus TaxID=568069 RepID=A0A1J1J8L3_9DIPT|nr:ND6 [Clunio marinus]
MNFLSSFIFMFIQHPLAMGLMLLIQTFLISILSGLMYKTFWFSYILFLIFIGGMLVLIIYITALASNEMFNFSNKILTLNIIFFILLMICLMMTDKSMILMYINNNENFLMMNMTKMISENSYSLIKIYNYPINMISILLMIYLFLTLIAAVKITNIFEGPLRLKTN